MTIHQNFDFFFFESPYYTTVPYQPYKSHPQSKRDKPTQYLPINTRPNSNAYVE